MVCPKCSGELSEVVKYGVVIDHCAGCGGIWLDKGEMGKIMGRLKQAESSLDDEFRPLFKEKRNITNNMTSTSKSGKTRCRRYSTSSIDHNEA